MSILDNRPMFEELQQIQEHQREGCVPMPPAFTPSPSGQSVLDKLAASLQQGDVALVLTRADLLTLASMVRRTWDSPDEFRILGNIDKLVEAKRP